MGIADVKTVGFCWSILQDGYTTKAFIDVPEANRKGLLKLFAADRKESNPPPFVPADATEFYRWRLDMPQAWKTLEDTIVGIYPAAKQGLDMFFETAGKDKDEKYDLKSELLGSLGNDIISYKKSPKNMTLQEISAQPQLFLIGSPKPEQLASVIKTFVESVARSSSVKEKDFLGRKLYTISNSDDENTTNSFNFAASGGYLAMSAQVSMIEEYLRSSENKPKALSETPGLAEAAEKVGGMNTGMFGYNNEREQVRIAFEMCKQNTEVFSQLFNLGMRGVADGEGWKKFTEWVDFSLLPEFNTISKYFHFSVFSVEVDATGYKIRGFQPFPPELKKPSGK
jgi:hypothetical protein